MKRVNQRGKSNEINSSSMADVAMLLLVFFLLTTNITMSQGIMQKLPPLDERPINTQPEKKRNVLIVLVNSEDKLMVNDKAVPINELREMTKEFIDNNGKRFDYSISPRRAIVSLQNDVGTSYKVYISVLNELKAAYRELRDEYTQELFAVAFDELNDKEAIDKVRYKYPYRLSEAEPVDIESEGAAR